MKIAILGWGSLIWQPKELNYNKEFDWKDNGPSLPIEFARISNNGRLTLVITKDGTELQTLYTLSNYKNIEEAVLDLAEREGSDRKSIGSYEKEKKEFSDVNFPFKDKIIEWINTTDFKAVIWTNHEENWQTKTNYKDRIEYLKSLKGETSTLAEEYIRKTPEQIRTEYRLKIEEQLNWLPILKIN